MFVSVYDNYSMVNSLGYIGFMNFIFKLYSDRKGFITIHSGELFK